MRKFKICSDPGHAWVKIKKKLLEKLGIADKISSYSYMRGDWAYLEEDSDAGIFVTEYRRQIGELELDETSGNGNRSSRIRNYESYRYDTNSVQFVKAE